MLSVSETSWDLWRFFTSFRMTSIRRVEQSKTSKILRFTQNNVNTSCWAKRNILRLIRILHFVQNDVNSSCWAKRNILKYGENSVFFAYSQNLAEKALWTTSLFHISGISSKETRSTFSCFSGSLLMTSQAFLSAR